MENSILFHLYAFPKSRLAYTYCVSLSIAIAIIILAGKVDV